jgi:hypothetical protein
MPWCGAALATPPTSHDRFWSELLDLTLFKLVAKSGVPGLAAKHLAELAHPTQSFST